MMKELRQICNSTGPLDMVHFFMPDLPKIEFDDLRKLNDIIVKNPTLAVNIVGMMINYNTESFYKAIREIMVEYGIIHKDSIIGKINPKIHEDIF